jgi:putative membrane protein
MHWFAWNGVNCFGVFGNLGLPGVILGVVLSLAAVAAAVLLVVWLVRGLASGPQQVSYATASAAPGSREILQQRYAHGEITRDQYLEMLDDLS